MYQSEAEILNNALEMRCKIEGTKALSESIEKFSEDLLTSMVDGEKGNFVCSGLGAHFILSMCSLGAKEKTAEEMHNVLKLDEHNSLCDFKSFLQNFQMAGNVKIDLLNKIFIDNGISVQNDFKQDINNYFLSKVEEVDIRQGKKLIESMCAKETYNKFEKVFLEEDIGEKDRLILLNAVYFKANWLFKFANWSTKKAPFYIDKENKIDIDMMHTSQRYAYKDLTSVNAEAVALSYENEDFLFVIIRPKSIDGLEQIEKNFECIELNYKKDFEHSNKLIKLALPKFKIESTVNLETYLKEMGMVQAYSYFANFEGISPELKVNPPIYINKFVQKATLVLNESGTEASALVKTGWIDRDLSEKSSILSSDFVVNRPFLFKIVNRKYNVTLFSGRVVKPTY